MKTTRSVEKDLSDQTSSKVGMMLCSRFSRPSTVDNVNTHRGASCIKAYDIYLGNERLTANFFQLTLVDNHIIATAKDFWKAGGKRCRIDG